jgi:alpha-D-xyloside xylohydrolase
MSAAAAGASLHGGSVAGAAEARAAKWEAVCPGVWKATLGTPEAHTPVRMRLVPPALEKMRLLPQAEVASLQPPRGNATPRGYVLSLGLAAGEAVYGFGLQLLSSECRGKKRTVRVNADSRVDSGDSHAPVPLYVSTSGYAILVDTLRQAEFYCGDSRPKPEHSQTTQAMAVVTPEQTAAEQRDQPARVTVEIPRAAGVEVYLFGGPTMLQAVQRYNLFSGSGFVPPEWGLGFWYRIELHARDSDVVQMASEFREQKIPCDVMGLEPGWQTHAYSCTFAWDRQRFPDPAAMMRQVSKLGFRVNLWEHAFTHPSSPLFDQLLTHSGDYGVWGGLVPDFAGSPAREAFAEYHQKQFVDIGIAGFKLDECDNSDFTGGWSFPDLSRFPSGLDGEQMHAVFGLRYQDAVRQAFLNAGKQTYGLARSSGALAAPYPFVLYSDLYDHREFVRGLVTSGFCGLLWCPEVRDAASDEDLIRRLQTVVFSPLAMVNAWYIKNPPWKQRQADLNNQGQFQENWKALEDRCRDIIGWRMQMLPYLLSAFQRYEQDGTPPFRALALDYPDQARLRKADDCFLIGDRMLVAPLFAGEPEREVLLPPGDWHDFWTGRVTRTSEYVPCSIKNIPVYVKTGSIIPWASVGASTDSPDGRELTARVYGDGHLSWNLGNELQLAWSASQKIGEVHQAAGRARPYQVVAWQHMDNQ